MNSKLCNLLASFERRRDQRKMSADLPFRNSPAKYKSKVWQHFGFSKTEEKKVICKHCLTAIKYDGGTSNMSTHISRHHKNLDYVAKAGKHFDKYLYQFYNSYIHVNERRSTMALFHIIITC